MKRPSFPLTASGQQRADTLGRQGHPCVQMPHLDPGGPLDRDEG